MKRVVFAAVLASVVGMGGAAQAQTLANLVSQGFEVRSVVRDGIDGGREIYLQRDNTMFICWVRISQDREVFEEGCRQIGAS